MLSSDLFYIERQLLAIRKGVSRDRLLGYVAALVAHNLMTIGESERVKVLALNASQHAAAVISDLQIQGWSEPDPFIQPGQPAPYMTL